MFFCKQLPIKIKLFTLTTAIYTVATADREDGVIQNRREAVKVGTVIVASETAGNEHSLVCALFLLGNVSSPVLHIATVQG